jgi:hypothetical protein
MTDLHAYLNSRISIQFDSRVTALARTIADSHPGTRTIIVYGSILRGIPVEETLLDFYIVVDDRSVLSPSAVGRFFGTLLPPNVYYLESGGLRCKYAVVTRADFRKWCGAKTANPYFWARFSQPVALAYASDDQARSDLVDDLSVALATANATALSLNTDELGRWKELFAETYRTELRPENKSRAANIVDANEIFYRAVSQGLPGDNAISANWPLRRLQGRFLSILRLAKAAFTFQGGADYAAWKIERHTGEHIELKDWHRRHPFIAGLVLLPRLLKRGAIR